MVAGLPTGRRRTRLAPVAAAEPSTVESDCARATGCTCRSRSGRWCPASDELTTAGTVASGHTVEADWTGLTQASLPQPSGVPGIQVDGYFPDTSTTNTNHGWNHDAQFVLRLPDRWNGGLVVSGSPGNRRQYANDRAIADSVLAKGYAFAATDKGNTGLTFYHDGRRPGDAIAEWNQRVTQLAIAAKAVVAQRYGRLPDAHDRGRHLQRRLPRALAAGEQPVALRRRHRLGGHAVARRRARTCSTFLPARDAGVPGLRGGFARRRTRRCSTRASRPARSSCGRTTTRSTGTSRSACTARSSTRRSTVTWTPASRTARAEPRTATRTTTTRPARRRCTARWPGSALTGRIGKPLITLHGTLDTLLPISQRLATSTPT